ncbi:MAG: hypothetical protein ABI690_06445 [Chloroflexota bacterium]
MGICQFIYNWQCWQICRRPGGREAREQPPSVRECAAGNTRSAAELAVKRRVEGSDLPLREIRTISHSYGGNIS